MRRYQEAFVDGFSNALEAEYTRFCSGISPIQLSCWALGNTRCNVYKDPGNTWKQGGVEVDGGQPKLHWFLRRNC